MWNGEVGGDFVPAGPDISVSEKWTARELIHAGALWEVRGPEGQGRWKLRTSSGVGASPAARQPLSVWAPGPSILPRLSQGSRPGNQSCGQEARAVSSTSGWQ